MKFQNKLKVIVILLLTSFTKIACTQNSTEDFLRIDRARAEFIALKTDSVLTIYYDIVEEQSKTIELGKKEINRHIKDKEALGELNKEQAKELITINNKLAKSLKANLTWFLVGAGVGVVVETAGIVAGVLIAK